MTIIPQTILPRNAHHNPQTHEITFTCSSGAYTMPEDEVNHETTVLFSNEDIIEDFIRSREASEQNARIPIGTF